MSFVKPEGFSLLVLLITKQNPQKTDGLCQTKIEKKLEMIEKIVLTG